MARFKDDLTQVQDEQPTTEAKRRITKTLAAIEVLDDLSDAQRQQVTDRIFSTTRTYQLSRNRGQEPTTTVGFSSRELRRLDTRVRRLRRTFEDLVKEQPGDDFWNWIGGDYLTEVFCELEDRVSQLRVPGDVGVDRSSVPNIQDVRSNCSNLLLFTFLVCSIRLGPASWRVAKIENVFWDGNVRETDEGTNRKRSSAILKRVYRPRRSH